MKIRTLIVSGIFALMAASGMMLTGCGGASCESVCEDGNACSGATKKDCAATCADAESLNEASGCGDEYDDLVSCSSDDVCNASQSCQVEGLAYAACTLSYCSDNPMATGCQSGS